MRSTASRTDPLARLTFLLAAGFAALLASAPAVTLWDETAHALVPWVSPDQYLYLNLSHVRPDAQGLVRNPWYGTTIPVSDVPFLRVAPAFRLFDQIRMLAGGDAQALVAWHAGIAIVIAAALLWMLSPVTRDQITRDQGTRNEARDRTILLAAFAGIMWVDPRYFYGDVPRLVSALISGVSPGAVHGLPYSGLFFPQLGVPAMLVAIGCLVRWLDARRHVLLIAVVMAVAWLALDAAVFTATSSAIHETVAGRGRLDCVWTIALTSGLGAIALFLPSVERHVRVVLGGFAIGLGLLRLASAFAPWPSMRAVGPYLEGFFGLAFWLPLIVIALEVAARVPRTVTRGVMGVAAMAFIAFAILDVRATTAAWRPYNRANGELARALGMLDLSADDVVVTPMTRGPASRDASWIPLVRPSTVLFSPGADRLLPSGSSEAADRFAMYRYLEGEQDLRSGAIPPFLRSARRLIIADYKDDPVFKADRIDRLFTVERLVRTGAWRVTIATTH